MATDSHVKSVTNTLTSTTADEITLLQLWPVVRITNHSTTEWLYARQDGVAVAEANGTTAIAPNTTRAVKGERAEGTNTIVVSVVGDGNTYTVEGINGGEINLAELQADVAALESATSLFVRKTADETVNNSQVPQDDDELTLAVVANTTYEMGLFLIYESTTTADFRMKFTAPAGASMDWRAGSITSSGNSATNSPGNWEHKTLADTCIIGGVGVGTPVTAQLTGLLVVDATAGSLQFQWAQLAAEAIDTKVKAGSFLTLRKVA